MKIREFINTKKGMTFINKEAYRIRYFYKLSAPIEDIRNELYVLLIEKGDEYNESYSVKTFIYNFISNRLAFIIRKKYDNYFHTEDGYIFVENVKLGREDLIDTEMVDTIDSEIFINECIKMLSTEDRAMINDRIRGITLDEIGERFGITKEAVRQRIIKASEKMGKVVCSK
jgi:RNA polymerase sigma factor (sigma-70 family)